MARVRKDPVIDLNAALEKRLKNIDFKYGRLYDIVLIDKGAATVVLHHAQPELFDKLARPYEYKSISCIRWIIEPTPENIALFEAREARKMS